MATMAAAAPQVQPPQEVYGVYCGSIEPSSVQRIFQNLTTATNPNLNITRVHLMFQSSGGFVGDGICLYNFFRTYPKPLTVYNCGSVLSIATIAYLGANERKTSAHALFQIHRSSVNAQNASAAALKGYAQSLPIDDSRSEAILREHLTLSDELWSQLEAGGDVSFSGEEAVRIGLATEIGDFAPPNAKQIFYV